MGEGRGKKVHKEKCAGLALNLSPCNAWNDPLVYIPPSVSASVSTYNIALSVVSRWIKSTSKPLIHFTRTGL